MKVIIRNVRISYANLFEARAIKNADGSESDPKYSATFIIDKKDKKTVKALNEAIDDAGNTKFGEKKWASMRKKKDPLMDGDEETDDDGEVRPELEGKYFIRTSASTRRKPQVVDRKRQPILSEDEIWSGCYVNASVNTFAFDVDVNKGVSFGLNNIQLLKEGDRLGGVANAEEDFEEIEDDDDDEDAGFEMN